MSSREYSRIINTLTLTLTLSHQGRGHSPFPPRGGELERGGEGATQLMRLSIFILGGASNWHDGLRE